MPCISHMPPHTKMNLSWQTHKIVYLTILDQASFWRLAGFVGLEFLGNETPHGMEAVWENFGNKLWPPRSYNNHFAPTRGWSVWFSHVFKQARQPAPETQDLTMEDQGFLAPPHPLRIPTRLQGWGAPLISLSSSIHEMAVQGSRLLLYWGFFVYLGFSRYIFRKIETTRANWGGICFEENKPFPG